MTAEQTARKAPRLIVLDGSSGTRINLMTVDLVRDYLGCDAVRVSGGVTSHNAKSALAAEYWRSLRSRSLKALREGRDVVLYAPILDGPGKQWVERLAEAGGARLVGLRYYLPYFQTKSASSNWENITWGDGELAHDIARRSVRRIDALAPPVFERQAKLKGQALKLVLLDCDDPRARRTAGEKLSRIFGEGSTAIDMATLRDELYKKALRDHPETQTSPELFENASWDLALERGIAALRQGDTLVLSGRFAETDKLDVIHHITDVTGAELHGYRLDHAKPGLTEAEEKTGLTHLRWPSTTPREAIPALVKSLALEIRPPKLADLILNLPDPEPGKDAPGLPGL